MERVVKNEPVAADRTLAVYLVSSSTGLPVQSATMSGTKVQISKNGGAWANGAGTWAEVQGSGAGKGGYTYVFTTGELDTPGVLLFKYEDTGVHQFMYSIQVTNLQVGLVVADGANTAFTFKTDLTQAVDDYWKHAFLVFTGGSLVGQVHKIIAYVGATKFVTFAATSGFTAAPSASDPFLIIHR